MQMYTQIKLKLKHKYTEAIEDSKTIIMQTMTLDLFLLKVWYGEEILPTCQKAPKQWL